MSRKFPTEQPYLIPMSGSEGFRAKTSQWREWAHAQGFEGPDLDSLTSLLDFLQMSVPEFLSSRMFRACSLATEDGISDSSFERWPTSGMASDGVCLTAGTSESPSRASESTLLDVIETREVPERYFLSPNAAQGMLRRANRMGRPLFPPLRKSLEILSRDHSSSE